MARDTSVTNSFPAPWQTLPANERDFRVRVFLSAGWTPATPFERADWHDAREISQRAEASWKKVCSAFRRVKRRYPEASEVQLVAQGKLKPFTGIPVSVFFEDGREATVVKIHWARFTNEEIATRFRQWLKANRPKDLRLPERKGHNKARDWRVTLERLGMMRLLHQHRLRDIPAACPKAWTLYQKREWYKERTRGHQAFQKFFPFLAAKERPICWPSKGGRSK